MNNENFSKEMLENLSIDELADLKIEADDLANDFENIIQKCDQALNS